MLRQSPKPNRGTTGLVWSILLVSTSGCIVGEGGKEDGYGPPHSVPSGGSAGWYEDDPMDDPDDSGTPPDGPEVTVTWGEDALHISVEGAPNGLWLGIVETGGSCASAGGCWTGEDCRVGFTSGANTYGPYCHSFDGDSVLSLTYDGDPTDLQPGSTAFEPHAEGHATYLLESRVADGGDGSCWVFGDDPTFYSAEPCDLIRL